MMRLIIVLITYNRIEYTKRTLRALHDTIQVPYYLVIADNASTDGTPEHLTKLKERGKADMVILNPENYYPGKACNIAWTVGLKEYPQATHLMRLDNDMQLDKGWDTLAEQYFDRIDRLGQLGLDYDGGEGKIGQFYSGMELVEWPSTVGGPCIIRKEIFESGKRYDETPWKDSGHPVQEDVKFSRAIKQDGWLVGHMNKRISYTFATMDMWKDYPSYYRETMHDRGWDDKLKKAGL